ncbi:Uncharacterized protein BM_BM10923 [Brugia malayi]|uniref:BMA-CEH-53 n=2 Tax=Brugia TaxID=6278 RepID=A0A0H5SCA4_BRUMA|nr:Uncharacterized protein BM_BM10923 [Brugia malayi]CRZ25970.1 BMA-CEH-53 [Brugia malayi]VDO22332.1 unnamed protein product [Brugia timori]VIO86265.1 Uncharacterized protein BM_BM10923 [Brugia malayi]
MKIEPLELTFFPYDFLSTTTITTITATTTTTTTTTTTAAANCSAIIEKSYHSKDDAKNSKLPRRRTAFTDQQLSLLENAFQKCQYPKMDVRMKLASEVQLPEKRIQVWFKNRRAKYRKRLRNIAGPEIAYDTSVSKFNAVITWKPNVALVFVTSSQEAMACRNTFLI